MNITRSLLVSAVFVLGCFETGPILAENASNQVNVPCPEYRKGRIWSYSFANQMFKTDLVITVLKNEGGRILLEQSTKTSIPNVPSAPSQSQMMKVKYAVREGAIVTLGEEGTEPTSEKSTYTSPMFVCGKIPNSWNSEKMSSVSGTSLVNVSVRFIENKTISVPAGKFDVEVFEFEFTEKQQTPVPNIFRQTVTQFVNAKTGIVKMIIDVETSGPSTGATVHPNRVRNVGELVSMRN